MSSVCLLRELRRKRWRYLIDKVKFVKNLLKEIEDLIETKQVKFNLCVSCIRC